MRDEDWPITILTPREIEVLTLTAQGLTYKQIAEQLGIAFKTVDAHRRNLARHLQISGAANLTRYAIRKGLVTP
jgi:DNA-binding NarL/FixJ family response regulator